jgi:hypothetical protein
MKKTYLLGIFITLFVIGGCANPNSHASLRKSFLTQMPYIQTDIPEPIEIDLAFMGREFLYKNPTYSSEQGFGLMCHLDTQNSLEPLQILGCGNIF